MTTYKTKDGSKTGFVPGVGEIVDGKLTVPDGMTIENANLEIVEDQPSPTAPAAPVASNPVPPAQAANPIPPTQTQTNQETN